MVRERVAAKQKAQADVIAMIKADSPCPRQNTSHQRHERRPAGGIAAGHFLGAFHALVNRFGYREIRFPVLE